MASAVEKGKKLAVNAGARGSLLSFGRKILVLLLAAIPLISEASPVNTAWTFVRSSHFEVYSETGERQARAIALWLEQLHAFFARDLKMPKAESPRSVHPVRVIEFRTEKEYVQFQLRPSADAYFIGGAASDYIVIPRSGPHEFRMIAHEFGHLSLHSTGIRFPPWFAEGIAEVYSSVRIGRARCGIGADLPERSQILRQRHWIPLLDLLNASATPLATSGRQAAELFYAESWELVDMLLFSPTYSPRLQQLWTALESGAFAPETLARMYGKPLNAIASDLRAWAETPNLGLLLPGITATPEQVGVVSLTRFESQKMIAGLLLASGNLDGAAAVYGALAKQRSHDAELAAQLGQIALLKNNRATALEQWKRAIDLGIVDAGLCYRFAVLAEDAGLPRGEIMAALRRALQLRPDFDNARYMLGLLESNAGNYAEALEQLLAMRSVAPARAYAYWLSVASACAETGRRGRAKQAARKALAAATTAEQRAAALEVEEIAATDLTVQFSRDANGHLRMVTARKPHGSLDWNPFIEPGDHILSLTGRIRKVDCTRGKITAFEVEGTSVTVTLTVPDPRRVMIAGGKAEFVCGAKDGREVAVQYAAFGKQTTAAGVLRGMHFEPQ